MLGGDAYVLMDKEFWLCFFEMGVLLTAEIIDQLESSTVTLRRCLRY